MRRALGIWIYEYVGYCRIREHIDMYTFMYMYKATIDITLRDESRTCNRDGVVEILLLVARVRALKHRIHVEAWPRAPATHMCRYTYIYIYIISALQNMCGTACNTLLITCIGKQLYVKRTSHSVQIN